MDSDSIVGIVVLAGLSFVLWIMLRRKKTPESQKKPLRPRNASLQERITAGAPPVSNIPSSSVRQSIPPAPPVVATPTESELRSRLSHATSQEACLEIYDASPAGSTVERDAMVRHDSFVLETLASATTAEECEEIRDELLFDDELTLKKVNDRVVSFLTDDLGHATTTDECLDVYDKIPGDDFDKKGDFAEIVLTKASALATTTQECLKVFDKDDTISVEVCGTILRKALALAVDSDDCTEVWDRCEKEDLGLTQEEVDLRRVDLAESIEECAELWEEAASWDDHLARAAILKAAELIRTQNSAPVDVDNDGNEQP